MGIKHLQSFMKDRNKVPKGVFKVDIMKAIQEHQTMYPEKKPLIVVDIMACRTVCQPMKESLFGFRATQYCARLEQLFRNFKDAGADIIFFEHCTIPTSKKLTWFENRNQQYMEQLSIIDEIIKGTPVRDIAGMVEPSKLAYPLLRHITKKYGEFIIIKGTHMDVAVAAYATEKKALAVIADDTDYLIFPGQWRVWSMRNLDDRHMTTLEYSKEALKATLDLTEEQLPMFATLAGNDILKYEDVQNFHKYLMQELKGGRRFVHKFILIAEFIRDFPSKFMERNLQYLGRAVGHLDLIKLSLASYSYKDKAQEEECANEESDPLLAKLLSNDIKTTYSILKGVPYKLKVSYEDFRVNTSDSSKKSLTDLALIIQQRLMGILLQNKMDPNISGTVYCKTSHEEGFKEIQIQPIYPEVQVPNLEELCILEEDDSYDVVRMTLFAWLFKDSFNPMKLFALDTKFISLLTVLALLVQESHFTVDDADILLCAYYDVYVSRVPTEEMVPEFLDINVFKNTFLVIRLMHTVDQCMTTIGLKHYMVPTIFDGVHYHHLYQKWHSLDEKCKDEKLTEIERFRAVYLNV